MGECGSADTRHVRDEFFFIELEQVGVKMGGGRNLRASTDFRS